MPDGPQVLLVHGAWHGAWCWEPLLPHLVAAGLDVATVDLPSAGHGGDLAADAAVVRAAIAARPGPTTLVGHSYGGQVISEAGADAAHLVYLCAFLMETGGSLVGMLDGVLPPFILPSEDGLSTTVLEPTGVFYADVEPSLAAANCARLQPQSTSSFAAPLTTAAWGSVPSTYVVCTEDQAIPVDAQRAMSAGAGTVHTLESSHSPFASHPAEVAAIIARVATA